MYCCLSNTIEACDADLYVRDNKDAQPAELCWCQRRPGLTAQMSSLWLWQTSAAARTHTQSLPFPSTHMNTTTHLRADWNNTHTHLCHEDQAGDSPVMFVEIKAELTEWLQFLHLYSLRLQNFLIIAHHLLLSLAIFKHRVFFLIFIRQLKTCLRILPVCTVWGFTTINTGVASSFTILYFKRLSYLHIVCIYIYDAGVFPRPPMCWSASDWLNK